MAQNKKMVEAISKTSFRLVDITKDPDKTIIFIPKGINIETMGAEGIAALRDHLNSVLESLNYDNIMGF